MSIFLRQMGPADAELMTWLERQVFPEDPWTADMVKEELAAENRYYVCALVNNDQQKPSPNLVNPRETVGVAGWAGLRLGEDGDVMTIGVLPDFRGLHIGRALMDHLLDVASKAHVRRLFLEVRALNAAAIHLYESVGFKQMGVIKRYFHHPTEDALAMRLIFGGQGPGAVGDEISKNALA